ncbi:MAG: glycoside hydrolase family 15 protein, partial [Burkholderiaceae bacterium]
GYHLVWPRDLAETAGGLLACGAHAEARRVIEYFAAIQEADGHWPQNSWLDGTSYWGGTQLDECAFPALVVDLALREGALGPEDVARIWPMLRLAARFILVNGPITAQDRWEEDGGYAPFTLAVVIASLLVCADLAEELGQTEDADFLRASADAWNSQIESWTYVEDTPLAREAGVSGYYVRIAPPEAAERGTAVGSLVPIRNRIPEETLVGSEGLVSPDALALVRFGLRSADDVRIRNTVQVIDHLLKVDFPVGPSWKRYNGDGYGEHADGRAFDGTGIGRAWPLLTGERAHFELAAGRLNVASALLETLEGLTSQGALLPEQAWDGPDLPDRELWFGKPTGSAMPLVWAHAEHLKLLRSLADGRVFDTPQAAARRYQGQTIRDDVRLWRLNNRVRSVTVGQRLRLELLEPAIVHWGINAWANTVDAATTDSSFGLSVLEISTTSLPPGTLIVFTWRDKTTGVWAGSDYSVRVIAPPG